ncbi:uncharacterized protein LOC135817433 isoform X1 [Sycon ciliatum]|uniref:uncharacterized protein LOC135817433 isoform X1 n=1 Tax=Sycon ciliatum TaxID=27933 RepID=UPI0020ADEAAB|eukprot:scpid58165/ scgid7787/ 
MDSCDGLAALACGRAQAPLPRRVCCARASGTTTSTTTSTVTMRVIVCCIVALLHPTATASPLRQHLNQRTEPGATRGHLAQSSDGSRSSRNADDSSIAGGFPLQQPRVHGAMVESRRSKKTGVRPVLTQLHDRIISSTVLSSIPAMAPVPVVPERQQRRLAEHDVHVPLANTETSAPSTEQAAENPIEIAVSREDEQPVNMRGREPVVQSQHHHSQSTNRSNLDGESCRLSRMSVIVRRGGCRKYVHTNVCQGTCNSKVKAERRPPFVQYLPKCCQPRTSKPVVIDMNDDECIQQRIKRKKTRLTRYTNITLLAATSCFCGSCSF